MHYRAKTTSQKVPRLDSTQLNSNQRQLFDSARQGHESFEYENRCLARLSYHSNPWPFPSGLMRMYSGEMPSRNNRQETPPEKHRKPPRRASVALPGTSSTPTKTMRLALTPAMPAISAMCPHPPWENVPWPCPDLTCKMSPSIRLSSDPGQEPAELPFAKSGSTTPC